MTQWGQGRGGRPWRRLRESILQSDKHLCQPCIRSGRYTQATEVDHIICKAKGGTDARDNLEAICQPCHADKTLVDSGMKKPSRMQRRQQAGHHWGE